MFWVAIAIFFLLGFGLTASENVSIGTPGGGPRECALRDRRRDRGLHRCSICSSSPPSSPTRSFATTASGFAPIVRATSVTSTPDRPRPLPRRPDHRLARLSRGPARHGGRLDRCRGSIPRPIGPQKLAYYAWNFAIFALPNIFLISALLFALATVLRSMMAAYIGAVAAGDGLSRHHQHRRPEDRISRRRSRGGSRSATARLREATRYWTQSEMNSRLVDLTGTMLFNRICAVVLGVAVPRLHRVALLDDRARAVEAAAAQARQARGARSEGSRPSRRRSAAKRSSRAMRRPSRWAQFMTRLRVEVRQVLTSPGLIVLSLFGDRASPASILWLGQSTYGTTDHPTLAGNDRRRPRRLRARSC